MKNFKIIFFFLLGTLTYSQSYAPQAGTEGSTAIHRNSTLFVGWATGIELSRGYKNIAQPDLGYAETGEPENALGNPTGSVTSLGDGGYAVLTFALPIIDGEGYDFAVFENGSAGYLELGLVEVSSDGINFFGFTTHSQTQTTTQIGTFGTPQAEYLNNIAGKYIGTYGTPFDISEVEDNPLLDKQNITHIKVIDVVGTINPEYATFDSYGNPINDSYPTPFSSGGFDLQAVGVINQKTLNIDDFDLNKIVFYPNPATDVFYLNTNGEFLIEVYDTSGRMIKSVSHSYSGINISDLQSGQYIIKIKNNQEMIVRKLVKK